ncbi:MAG: hypothetical protein ABI896_01665 [Actinomycetota bacterium]
MAVSAADAVSFPELVWAHYLYVRELHANGELHAPVEDEYREKLERFVEDNGKILNAYWCTSEASAVALTEKKGDRVWGFLWRRQPSIRFHSATDWVTKGSPDIGHALHAGETLAIRVAEVLSGTSERIAMQWVLSVSGYLLGIVDQANGRPSSAVVRKAANRSRSELAHVEHYYDRAGEKTGRLIYFWGMMLGLVALGVLAVFGTAVYSIFGTFQLKSPDTQTFYVCYTMGAVGAFVSVMTRMAGGGDFTIDYEVGRPALRRVGSFRPIIGAIFAVVLYLALRGGLIQLQTEAGMHTTYFYGALAFLTGFSERRAKIILGGATRIFQDGEPTTADSKKAPSAPSPGGSAAGAGSSG